MYIRIICLWYLPIGPFVVDSNGGIPTGHERKSMLCSVWKLRFQEPAPFLESFLVLGRAFQAVLPHYRDPIRWSGGLNRLLGSFGSSLGFLTGSFGLSHGSGGRGQLFTKVDVRKMEEN